MLMFEWILVLLLAAVILANLAERLAVPYPSLLAIAGAGLAFLPFAPQYPNRAGARIGAVRGAGAARRIQLPQPVVLVARKAQRRPFVILLGSECMPIR